MLFRSRTNTVWFHLHEINRIGKFMGIESYQWLLWSLWFLSFYWLWVFFVFPLVVLSVGLGCLFEIFLVSWGEIELLETSLLELLLLCPIGFGSLCFHCHLFLCIFLISSLISSVISCLLSSILFILHVFVFFTRFFL